MSLRVASHCFLLHFKQFLSYTLQKLSTQEKCKTMNMYDLQLKRTHLDLFCWRGKRLLETQGGREVRLCEKAVKGERDNKIIT